MLFFFARPNEFSLISTVNYKASVKIPIIKLLDIFATNVQIYLRNFHYRPIPVDIMIN